MSEYNIGGTAGSTATFNTPGQGRVEFLAAGKVVASAIARSDGRFRVSLPAGHYTARWPAGGTNRSCELGSGTDHLIVVRAGKVTRITLFCATTKPPG